MLIDKENLLSYKQAITVTAVSTNVIDLGPNHWAGASGNDSEIPLFMHVDEAFAAAGAATLSITIESSNSETFASGVVAHELVGPIALANLAQPKRMPLSLAIPPDVKRYVRASYTVATGPMTAGKLTLGVTASRQTNY